MPELTNAQVLRKAQDVLRERGWHGGRGVGNWEGPDGCLCVGAAISVALGGDPVATREVGKVRWQRFCDLFALLRPYTGDHRSLSLGLYAFNDSPGRTLEQVLDLLERAAIAEEGKERGEATGDSGGQGPDHHGGGG